VADVAESVLHSLRGLAADKHIDLRNDIQSGLPLIGADIDRLDQVLTNLVDNAIKFTPREGRITISARVHTRRWPVLGLQRPGERPAGAFAGMETSQGDFDEYVIVSVRDTGIGINAIDEQRIFDKFGQVGNVLTDKPQGTGLGLAISGSIVMQHGGALWVESIPGVGSMFSFSIPVAGQGAAGHGRTDPRGRPRLQSARAPKQPGELAASSPTGPARSRAVSEKPHAIVEALQRSASGKQIMIVDDEPSIVAALTELLHPHGYRTVGCHSGSEAVARARDLRPDAIILDIMMPEINGYDVLRLLKSEAATAAIPVIVLSVLDDKSKALELGAAEYVRKPFQKEELLENVRALA
jgi:CheY-like chemotaxis protein